MDTVKLDLGKLLGFKIIANGESTMRLTSPKIGDKACAVVTEDATYTSVPAALMAKVGVKTG